jgi:hypothetical protein
MPNAAPIELTEDRVPVDGIEKAFDELVELYGGEVTATDDRQRRFILPLRRGMVTAGGVECTLTWSPAEGGEATLTLICNRDVDAPRMQRIAMLTAGVVGALLFTIWPFFPKASTELGTIALLGGVVAIAVYLLSLRKSSGGVAADFLQRLAHRQRALPSEPIEQESS